jgi:hypothetical protein
MASTNDEDRTFLRRYERRYTRTVQGSSGRRPVLRPLGDWWSEGAGARHQGGSEHSENGRARPYNGVVRRPNANGVALPAVGLSRTRSRVADDRTRAQ